MEEGEERGVEVEHRIDEDRGLGERGREVLGGRETDGEGIVFIESVARTC